MREDLKGLVLSGKKTATTRLGVREVNLGPAIIVFNESGDTIPVEIIGTSQLPFKAIDEALAAKENHSVVSLKKALETIYGPIQDTQMMTVIEFKLVL